MTTATLHERVCKATIERKETTVDKATMDKVIEFLREKADEELRRTGGYEEHAIEIVRDFVEERAGKSSDEFNDYDAHEARILNGSISSAWRSASEHSRRHKLICELIDELENLN